MEEDEEEIERIEEEADEICANATHENCPEEICGDMCEIWDEEDEMRLEIFTVFLKES